MEAPKENPDAIKNYAKTFINGQKLDVLMKEMVQNVILTKSNKPVIDMMKYLAKCNNETDLEKEGIRYTPNPDEPEFEVTPMIKRFIFPENTTNLLKNELSPTVFEQLKSVKTVFGGRISHLIDSCLKLDTKESINVNTTDADCYNKFQLLLKPIIDNVHSYDKVASLFDNAGNDVYNIDSENDLIKKVISYLLSTFSTSLS